MKYYNLHITTNNFETFQKVTTLLNVIPLENPDDFSLWTYQVTEDDEAEYFDFINNFIDILEPNFERLKSIGINKEDIIIWLFYEYEQQCSMSFNPQEMKRLGQSGISFNIDCIETK